MEIESGMIATNDNGKALDGGGHENKGKASRQAGYINDGLRKKAEKDQ